MHSYLLGIDSCDMGWDEIAMDDVKEFRGEYRWLSNFTLIPIQLDDEIYPSVEHAYQAAKTMDARWRGIIQKASSPGQAKAIGRNVPLREGWDKIKEEVMLGLLRDKFGRGSLRDKLIATGKAELIEGNYWGDIYWGVCRGVGKNRLGQLLMQVRRELINGISD